MMFQREANKPPGSPTGLEGYEILVSSAATAPGKLSNGVFRFNAGTGRFEGVLGEGAGIHDPRGLRPAPDESYFVVNNGDDSILKFETATRRFLGVVARLPGLNPGGGKFGSDGRYYVGSRSWKSVVAFDVGSGWKHSTVLQTAISILRAVPIRQAAKAGIPSCGSMVRRSRIRVLRFRTPGSVRS